MSVAVTFEPSMTSLGPAVAAIGVFDGVHLGHQKLLDAAVRDAVRRDVRAVAVTFDRDPDTVIDPDTAAPQLLTLEDKVKFIGQTGVEVVLVVPFTPEVAAMAPERFLAEVLAVAIEPQAIHVGHDFRFGARASGDVGALEAWAEPRGMVVVGHRLLEIDGDPVTSTRIRDLIAAGEVAAARDLLGRPPRVTGDVVHGRGAGKGLGVPTANLVPVPFAALPEDGVYAGLAEVAEGIFGAAISVGMPPMFPEAKEHLEAHLIDYDGDLYGQPMALEFLKRLRGLKRYGSLEELTAAIRKDVREAADIVERQEAEL
ncbi:MAG: riboflavin biosynthesis protein RibF, partial [Coriobacteriales bacterium]|nr:riboflavin biosynthesis protein RibF [Coriobacteriales bacterium]